MEILTTDDSKKLLRAQLQADTELLIRVPGDEGRNTATIRLQPVAATQNEPRVEIFGAPLQPDVRYHLLAGTTYTLFAWTNATVEIAGSHLLVRNVMRSGTRSLTRPILEFHCLTQERRSEAEKLGSVGPVTLICGRDGLTKTLIARSLCSYAARSGWRPLYVDLDCGELQSVGIPGTVGAAVIDFPTAVDDVMSLTHVAITYFVGTTDAQKMGPNGESVMSAQYTNYANALLGTIRDRLHQHKGNIYAASGAVVIVPELRDNSGVNYITDLIQEFGVTNIMTVGDDYLFHKLLAHPGIPSRVQVDKMSQSFLIAGTLPPEELLPIRFDDYFLGTGAVTLLPSQWTRRFERLEVLQLKEDGDQVVCANVERNALLGIVGCLAALFKMSKEGTPLNSTPVVYARVQSVDAVSITFLTTTHFTYPSEKLIVVVGSVRWITSAA